jgi:hypothetical protein
MLCACTCLSDNFSCLYASLNTRTRHMHIGRCNADCNRAIEACSYTRLSSAFDVPKVKSLIHMAALDVHSPAFAALAYRVGTYVQYVAVQMRLTWCRSDSAYDALPSTYNPTHNPNPTYNPTYNLCPNRLEAAALSRPPSSLVG